MPPAEDGRPLERYQSMRDFGATPEPSGAPLEVAPADGVDADGAGNRFVIQQHDATRLHWDLRLEHEGVLASWALPRGLPWSPDDNHLAVHTEDHPIEYLTFSGDIPDGSYGAGAMSIWDTGTYETEKFEPTKVTVVLHGERAKGRYALFRTRGRDWIIHRMDPPEDPARRPPPTDLRPMLATPGPLPPDGDSWAFEIRWRGERALVTSTGGVVGICRETGDDVSSSFPEVRRMGRALGSTEVVLDGVLAAPDPSVGRAPLDRRLEAGSESTVRRLARDQPLTFIAFDLLWLDGHPTIDHPWRERRRLLDELRLAGPAWQCPAAHLGDGVPLLEAATARGLAGLVAKRVDSAYEAGRASEAWVEVVAGA